MRGWLLAGLLLWAGSAQGAVLKDRDCPYAEAPSTHIAACSRFFRDDEGTGIAFDIAVLTPIQEKSVGTVVYIPGGPGEAPVSEDGLFDDLLMPFSDRKIIVFNPRGTLGTLPRMECDFGALIWKDDFGGPKSQDVLESCIERFQRDGPDPAHFTSLEIAEDIDAMLGALGIVRAGVYGISYGTEAALHLLAQAPRWLDFAILDSVSVPGLSGIEDEIMARDRFLEALDIQCFEQKRCPAIARGTARTLSDWAARFDEEPLALYIRDNEKWTFTGADILDYLAQLGAYPDGLAIAKTTLRMLETSRLRAMGWMSADLSANTEFAEQSLPLMLQAYADTFDPSDFQTIAKPTRYARNSENAVRELEFQRLWRGTRQRENAFLDDDAQMVPVPVLVLSGRLDPFTPVEWAEALEVRFSGLERYVFPLLGHALSVGPVTVEGDETMTMQLRCAREAVYAFLDPTLIAGRDCRQYEAGE